MLKARPAVRRCAALGAAVATSASLLALAAPAAVAAPLPASADVPTALLVDAGASRGTGAWSADLGALGGRSTGTSAGIAGTTSDVLYQRQRVGMTGYRLDVADGTYALTLHFAETYFAAAGRRVFDVTAEGRPFATGLDVFRAAGRNRAHRVTRQVVVTDGALDLGFRARVNAPLLAALELRPVAVAPSAPQGVAVSSSSDGTAVLTWEAPARDGGAPVTAYRVIRMGTDSTGAGPWTTVLPADARTFTFEKLSPATTYDFVVYGRNAAGSSAQVTVSTTTPYADGASADVRKSPVTPSPSPTATVAAPAPVLAPQEPLATLAPVSAPTYDAASWPSGVYVPGSDRTRNEAFAAWRGRPLDVVVDWPARATWNDIVNPSWLYDSWAGTPYTKVFGVAMVPEQDASATLATCASGAHDAQWRQFGTNIRARGLDDETIVRLGWEFNGDWYKWSAKDPQAFVQCWRHIVTSAESTAPALRWDWTVNRGRGQSVADPTLAYPGDEYVDVVGVDSYDGWPGAVDESTWQQHYAGAFGLKSWADFARAHGKKLSVPEWGVYPGTAWAGNNGGDNPFYVAKMVEFFRSQADNLAYEAYFNESASYYAGSLYGPVQNPKAAAEYARLY